MALACLTVLGVLSASFLSAEITSSRSTDALAASRARGGGADGAVGVAVNRIKGVPELGRDPLLFPSDGPCVLNVPTSAGVITTTCAAASGSGSGALAVAGSWPSAPDATQPGNRIMTVAACTRGAGRDPNTVTGPCDAAAGDRLLLQARVRFDVTIDSSGTSTANVPVILSWAHQS